MDARRVLAFGPYQLDLGRRELLRDGIPLHLTPKDYGVLLALVERPGQIVDKEVLFGEVWPGVVVEECNLARHVANLRRHLGDDAEAPTYIQTVARRGYRFVAGVRAWEGAPTPPALAQALDAGRVELGRRADPRHLSRGRIRRAAFSLMAALALPGGAWLAGRAPAATGLRRSLAVLPAANLTGDARHDTLAAALTEMLVNDLGRSGLVRVLPRSSTAAYRDTVKLPGAIAGELGVDAFVEASIVQAGEDVRVTAELVDARTQQVVWAEAFQGRGVAMLDLQQAATFALIEALEAEGGAGEPSDLPPPVSCGGRGVTAPR
jgi:DNA-binding winged helix-turn-helix (wHTH) protein/TolB-like protein